MGSDRAEEDLEPEDQGPEEETEVPMPSTGPRRRLRTKLTMYDGALQHAVPYASAEQSPQPMIPVVEQPGRGVKRGAPETIHHRKWDHPPSESIPRHNSWDKTGDEHLYSIDGKRYTKINVQDCREIFVPVGAQCYMHDEVKPKDYWIIAGEKGRSQPRWTDWKAWWAIGNSAASSSAWSSGLATDGSSARSSEEGEVVILDADEVYDEEEMRWLGAAVKAHKAAQAETEEALLRSGSGGMGPGEGVPEKMGKKGDNSDDKKKE